ncbi:glycosyltransferase [Desulfohalobiaceae bacterium Ax17]|uniref:CgeB family protein n=1 Tax=Desulfovulcanus ferrireducens TaxID=2831190 RepID=UPI00207BB385|nr:glycosyltransferase [Desulfovulcanus ferrireducens]MBT8763367.1 glycosyltransferase [Desulfovulcanus ferrireducens]
MKIIFLANLAHGSTSMQRMKALQRLGHSVIPLDTKYTGHWISRYLQHQINRIDYHLTDWRIDPWRVNSRLLTLLDREQDYQALWLERALMVRPATLKKIAQRWPHLVIAGYSPDDQMNPANHSRIYLKSIPLYDVLFTNKTFNVSDLYDIGARSVVFVKNGFDPDTHRPVPLTSEERERFGAQVSFVGTFERERAEYLRIIAEMKICTIKVWGNDWNKMKNPGALKSCIQGIAVYGDDYARVICASNINLCFLRKANRDQVTTRSVEIPACGGFMLAERTDEHLALFAEDREAAYFVFVEEMNAKVKYYLEHPKKRHEIAKAGRQRCLNAGYSNLELMKGMVEILQDEANRKNGSSVKTLNLN